MFINAITVTRQNTKRQAVFFMHMIYKLSLALNLSDIRIDLGKLELLPEVVGQQLEAAAEFELGLELLIGSSWPTQHLLSSAYLQIGDLQSVAWMSLPPVEHNTKKSIFQSLVLQLQSSINKRLIHMQLCKG